MESTCLSQILGRLSAYVVFILLVRICVCINLHLSVGSSDPLCFHRRTLHSSLPFGRKILIEEDGSSFSRIWVAAVILTVYNETAIAGRIAMERREKGLLRGELDPASNDRNLYHEER